MLPGLLGALMAFAASNLWFYLFAEYVFPGVQGQRALPDFFAYLVIDVYVGVGCAYAGTITGPVIAGILGPEHRLARIVPALSTALLGTALALTVNAVLLFMASI